MKRYFLVSLIFTISLLLFQSGTLLCQLPSDSGQGCQVTVKGRPWETDEDAIAVPIYQNSDKPSFQDLHTYGMHGYMDRGAETTRSFESTGRYDFTPHPVIGFELWMLITMFR